MAKMIDGVKFYPVSERMMFGLESMYEKCMTRMELDELRDDEYEHMDALMEECEKLICTVQHYRGFASGKDYGRIKKITQDREWMRYQTCLAAGMSKWDAARALG